MIYCKACGQGVSHIGLAAGHLHNCTRLNPVAPETRSIPEKYKAVSHNLNELEKYFYTPRNPKQLAPDYIFEEQWRSLEIREIVTNGTLSPHVRASVKRQLADILHNDDQLRAFRYQDFSRRLGISSSPTKTEFYRKMSDGERNALKPKDPFGPVLDYMNADLYRYWMSSSLAKVRLFGNENSTDDGGRIVKFTFKMDLWDKFAIRAHQKPGVQGDKHLVAVHREGFAEIGNMDSDESVDEVKGPPRLDHNLGFTTMQKEDLKTQLLRFEDVI